MPPLSDMPQTDEHFGGDFNRLYTLCKDEEVGEGAFARVLVVRSKKDEKAFACKVLDREAYALRTMTEQLELEVEVATWAGKEHQNIIELVHHFRTEKFHFLIMDMVTTNLLRMAQEAAERYVKGFDDHVVRGWMNQVRCALVYLHENGVVHRDVKLDNMLYEPSKDNRLEGEVKLTDFGWCARLDERGQCRGMCGTIMNNAPEVNDENVPYTNMVDSWMFGFCLFMLLVFDPLDFDTSARNWREEKLLPWIKSELEKRRVRTHGLRPISSQDHRNHSREPEQIRGREELLKESVKETEVKSLSDIILHLMNPDPTNRWELTHNLVTRSFDDPIGVSPREVCISNSLCENAKYHRNNQHNPDVTWPTPPGSPLLQGSNPQTITPGFMSPGMLPRRTNSPSTFQHNGGMLPPVSATAIARAVAHPMSLQPSNLQQPSTSSNGAQQLQQQQQPHVNALATQLPPGFSGQQSSGGSRLVSTMIRQGARSPQSFRHCNTSPMAERGSPTRIDCTTPSGGGMDINGGGPFGLNSTQPPRLSLDERGTPTSQQGGGVTGGFMQQTPATPLRGPAKHYGRTASTYYPTQIRCPTHSGADMTSPKNSSDSCAPEGNYTFAQQQLQQQLSQTQRPPMLLNTLPPQVRSYEPEVQKQQQNQQQQLQQQQTKQQPYSIPKMSNARYRSPGNMQGYLPTDGAVPGNAVQSNAGVTVPILPAPPDAGDQNSNLGASHHTSVRASDSSVRGGERGGILHVAPLLRGRRHAPLRCGTRANAAAPMRTRPFPYQSVQSPSHENRNVPALIGITRRISSYVNDIGKNSMDEIKEGIDQMQHSVSAKQFPDTSRASQRVAGNFSSYGYTRFGSPLVFLPQGAKQKRTAIAMAQPTGCAWRTSTNHAYVTAPSLSWNPDLGGCQRNSHHSCHSQTQENSGGNANNDGRPCTMPVLEGDQSSADNTGKSSFVPLAAYGQSYTYSGGDTSRLDWGRHTYSAVWSEGEDNGLGDDQKSVSSVTSREDTPLRAGTRRFSGTTIMPLKVPSLQIKNIQNLPRDTDLFGGSARGVKGESGLDLITQNNGPSMTATAKYTVSSGSNTNGTNGNRGMTPLCGLTTTQTPTRIQTSTHIQTPTNIQTQQVLANSASAFSFESTNNNMTIPLTKKDRQSSMR